MFSNLFIYGAILEFSKNMFGFEHCILLVDVGPFKRGDVIQHVWFDPISAEFEFYLAGSETPDYTHSAHLEFNK